LLHLRLPFAAAASVAASTFVRLCFLLMWLSLLEFLCGWENSYLAS
jgi:hypothetical protein